MAIGIHFEQLLIFLNSEKTTKKMYNILIPIPLLFQDNMTVTFLKNIIKHVVFYAATFLWTCLLGIFVLPLLLCPKRWNFWASRLWANGILFFAKCFLQITYQIRGLDNLPINHSFIIASKHQSVWETLIFSTFLDNPVFFIKKSLLHLPLIGWFFWKLNMIPVSRSSKKKSRSWFLQPAYEEAVVKKRPLIIFPEATRVAAGETRRYHYGVFFIYEYLKIPVVPAALNSGIFWERRGFFKKPGVIILSFLPPILPKLERKVFMHELQHKIETASKDLLYSPNE